MAKTRFEEKKYALHGTFAGKKAAIKTKILAIVTAGSSWMSLADVMVELKKDPAYANVPITYEMCDELMKELITSNDLIDEDSNFPT